jgi:DNA-binding winged helix-turn-helix (wHTH) protein
VDESVAYRFGPFLFNSDSRLLLRDGEPVPLTAKVLETLTVLVQNRHRVMDKSELLAALWPDTVVEEANLTQNISTLRKALGDNPKDHFYIATIAGRGYRFVAGVVELTQPAIATPPAGEGLEAPEKWRPPIRWAGLALGALLLMLLMVAIWRWIHAGGRDLADELPQAVPFTSLRGFVEGPTFSPDGKEVAYVQVSEEGSRSLYVKLIGGGNELRLTSPPGEDRSPAWSPDGRQLAFWRDLSGHRGIYIVSALGGPVHQVLRTDLAAGRGLAWLPDGRHLVFSQGVTVQKHGILPLFARRPSCAVLWTTAA